jgi:hypothetical protein
MTPLRLTDSQLHAVRKAASLLRPQARDALLRLLAHELKDLDPPDDAAVNRVVDLVFETAALRLAGGRKPTTK